MLLWFGSLKTIAEIAFADWAAEHMSGTIAFGVLAMILAIPIFRRKSADRPLWLLGVIGLFILLSGLTLGIYVHQKIITSVEFSPEWLTADRQTAFKMGAGSIIAASGNYSSTKIEIVAEPQSGAFASKLRDTFILASLPIQDVTPTNPVSVPKDYRLNAGVTIVAPMPSLAAEEIRVGFERIGIQTRRSTDKARVGDYLIVEVGAAP